ncbi:MAG: hypothetical protein ACYS19_03915 [Planctomycetota bacterium]
MRTRIVLCVSIVFLLAGTLAAQTTYIGSDGGKWSVPANWTNGLPSASNKAYFVGPSACILDIQGAEAWQLDGAGGPLQIVDGGTLTVLDWCILGYQADDIGENAGRIEVYDGGVLNCNVRFYVGYRAEGFLTIYEGGTVNIHSQLLGVGRQPGGNGVVTLEGGSLNLLEGTNADGLGIHLESAEASMDFRGGVMTLRDTPDNRDSLDRGISNGIIKAYSGVGELVVDSDETLGTLAVRGVHPLKPFPSDDGLMKAGDVELSWTLPDPCVPGQPVSVDVYFTDDLTAMQQFTDPAAIQVVNKQNVTSVVVQTQSKTRYYWAVDTYVGSAADPVYGPIFSFVADNLPPEVDAGNDVVTWLADGVRVGNLDATVIDQDAVTVQWTVVSEPDAVIDIQIANGNDDAEQHVGNGNMDIGSSDLELAYEDAGDPATDEQVIGLRFVDVPLENGSLVANAYVEVTRQRGPGESYHRRRACPRCRTV